MTTPKDLNEFPLNIQQDIDKLIAKRLTIKAKAKQNKPAQSTNLSYKPNCTTKSHIDN